jgi:hypothetical protein
MDPTLPTVDVGFACDTSNAPKTVIVTSQGDIKLGDNAAPVTVMFNLIAQGSGVTIGADFFQYFPLPFESSINNLKVPIPMYQNNDPVFSGASATNPSGSQPYASFTYDASKKADNYRIYRILFYHGDLTKNPHIFSVDPKISNGSGADFGVLVEP